MSLAVLSEETWLDIFSFLSGEDVVRCSRVCRGWKATILPQRSSLWRRLVGQDFGVRQGHRSTDWRTVYAYIYTEMRNCQVAKWIDSKAIFADDGLDPNHTHNHEAQNALDASSTKKWCTNAHVDHDVDLVADLGMPHLVVAFKVDNVGSYYERVATRSNAPVAEALAFASWDMPDLEAGRWYNGFASSDCTSSQVGGGDQRGKMSCMPASTKPLACFLRTHDEVMVERCNRPTVARFAHFKLLRSSSVGSTRPGNEPRNMEVVNLHTFGIPLPRLAGLLRLDREPQVKETSWKRLHPVREEYEDWSPIDWTTLASLPTPPIEDDWADWFRTNNPAYSDNYDGPYPLPLSYPLPHVYFFA